ncbi:hypothetical protein [Limisalsivibrio acetivorans]|uniref:hypothetical protein n=1 Tax=Limisalsivibrio acetivorans TaxID=1304888 RepID=UPI0003B5EEF4|nr:hypothetical protein [Limisalsivibrio acetivorans]
MRYLLSVLAVTACLLTFTADKSPAFDDPGLNTPDSWSQHVSPGSIKESYNGIGMGKTSLYMTLTSRYRLRSSNYADDQDFYQYLRAHTDATELGNGTMRVSAFARFADDIDGEQNNDWSDSQYYYHRDALDAELESNDWAPRLYHGFVTLDNVVKNTVITAGRFYLDHINTFQLDGADASVTVMEKVEVYAFGGKPVSYYYDIEDDRVYGGGVKVTPLDGTTVAVEYANLDVSDIEDDYARARLTQLIPNGNISVEYEALDESKTLSADATYEIAATKTIVTVSYKGLLEEVEEGETDSYVVNPLTNALMPEEEYSLYKLSVYQGISNFAALGLGTDQKSVSGDEGFTNRSYSRFYGNFDIFGIPTENTYISFKMDLWNVDENDMADENEKIQYGIEISQRINDSMDVWLGSSYNKYEYDYVNDTRKDSVRSYYIGGQYSPTDYLSFLADVNIEDTEFFDDIEDDDLDRNLTAELWANIIF